MPEFPRALSGADFTESVIACITDRAERGVPLLALGQTVFWDELLKSMLVEAAQQYAPELRLVAGAHDTDYFSKLPEPPAQNGGFSLQPRDDDRTRQMWAAVAETSAVLGTEHPVTRQQLRSAGVPLRQLARRHPDGPRQFYREATMAWGWRGVANHGADRTVACDILAARVAPTVLELMEWAVDRSRDVLLDDSSQRSAERVLAEVERLVGKCRAEGFERTLTDLYLCLLHGFYDVLLGAIPRQARITASTDIFLFTPNTVDRPRFDVVDIFLDPETRPAASAAYDTVMGHTGIYRLEQFGEGAIPFDIVVCGRGRGTIRVVDNRVIFELPNGPAEAEMDGPVTNRHDLLRAGASVFGCALRLIGKAVVLPTMMSREFTMVMLENASVYLPQTHRLIRMLRRAGIELELHPLARLHFETYDAMEAADACLRLPPHLARLFGEQRLTARQFAQRWRAAVARARTIIERLGEARAPDDILRVLEDAGEEVGDLRPAHDRVAEARRESGSRIQALRERSRALWIEIKQLLRAADAAHEAPPEDELQPLREQREQIIARILELAQSEEHLRLQERYHEIILEIQQRKLRALADAYRTVGLEMSNYRPPWWWFVAVDASGAWLRRLAETATMRFEPFGMMV
ncbi:MAG: hypothetical protein U9R79_06995 [Armatimonadota bacterium]|nr:hypothetical protein [Armatimonadota bacterium]